MKQIIKSISNTKFTLVLILGLVVASIVLVWFNRFAFSPEIASTTRFSLKTENETVVSTITGKYGKQVDETERGVDSENKRTISLYFRNLNEEGMKDVRQILTDNKVEFSVENVIPRFNMNYAKLAIFFAVASATFMFILYIASRKIISLSKFFMISFIGLDIYFIVLTLILGIYSVLGLLGWQFSIFTLSSFIATSIVVLAVLTSILYEGVRSMIDKKVTSISGEIGDFIDKSSSTHFVQMILASVLLVPFMVLYDYTVEIFVLVLSIWMTYVVTVSLLKNELSIFESIGKKKKK